MKKLSLILLLALTQSYRAIAVVSGFSVNPNTIIPDGDLNGIQSSMTVSGLPNTISDVNVTLTVSSGFNGDFYAYLLHGSTSAILLNRVGRTSSSAVGYPDAGFGTNGAATLFTFDDQGGQDVHLYRTFSYTLNLNSQLTGTWQSDGRAIDPLSSGSVFDSAPRSRLLNGFNGADPNGTWTLFIADVSSGGEGTLANWGLSITAVPEPAAGALLLTVAGLWFIRRRRA